MIQPGDIICVYGDRWVSKMIRWSTGTKASHVAICLDEKTVWQTDVGIDVSKGLLDFDHYAIIRYRHMTPELAAKIFEYCEQHEGARYAKISILGYFLKYKLGFDILIEDPDGFTCNQLVERAFHHADIELFGLDALEGNEIPGSYLELPDLEPDDFELVFSNIPGMEKPALN